MVASHRAYLDARVQFFPCLLLVFLPLVCWLVLGRNTNDLLGLKKLVAGCWPMSKEAGAKKETCLSEQDRNCQSELPRASASFCALSQSFPCWPPKTKFLHRIFGVLIAAHLGLPDLSFTGKPPIPSRAEWNVPVHYQHGYAAK